MKRRIIILVSITVMTAILLAGCSNSDSQRAAESQEEAVSAETGGNAETDETTETDRTGETGPSSKSEENEEAPDTESASPAVTLEDGVYTAEFDTDSSMFHISEACDGKGTLTVENGMMVMHVSLASKNIVNLFPGLAEDARKDGAELLEPTTDSVTYSDGITEEVYGFDIPVPAIDQEFDLALIGTKGNWYDHKVSVTNPEKME